MSGLEELLLAAELIPTRDAVAFKIASSTNPKRLVSENPNRVQLAMFNDSTAAMFLQYGTDVTTDNWTVQLAANDYYETIRGYIGVISIVWAAANGQLRGVEIVRAALPL